MVVKKDSYLLINFMLFHFIDNVLQSPISVGHEVKNKRVNNGAIIENTG